MKVSSVTIATTPPTVMPAMARDEMPGVPRIGVAAGVPVVWVAAGVPEVEVITAEVPVVDAVAGVMVGSGAVGATIKNVL